MAKTTSLEIFGFDEYKKAIDVAVKINTPVLLIGETGTGKTTLVNSMAVANSKTFVRVNLNGQTSKDEFVGKYVLKGKEMVWEDGILTACLRNGYWLLVDEINAALPEILFSLHSVLDDDRSLLLIEKDNEKVEAHEDFRFFAAMNPVEEYAGTKDLNKAFMSRFGVVLEIEYPSLDSEVKILEEKVGLKDTTQIKAITALAIATRDMKKAEKIFTAVSTRDLMNIGKLLIEGYALMDAISLGYLNKISKEEIEELVKEKIIDNVNVTVKRYYTAREYDKLEKKLNKEKNKIRAEVSKEFASKFKDLFKFEPPASALEITAKATEPDEPIAF